MKNATKRKLFDTVVWSASLLFAFILVTQEAMAGSHVSSATNAKWKAECGSCHLAYPPSLLSAEAWRRIMAGLDRHFGSDASLDAASAVEIGAFLERNASRRDLGPVDGAPRITQTARFLRKHREVDPALWKSPRVKTASNCTACHRGAADGDFDEDNVRIPR